MATEENTDTAEEGNLEESAMRRAIAGAAIGHALEWFDFGVYGYFAVTIGEVFFPSDSSSGALLKTFAIFAVAFVARPFGSLVFGPLGDKIGRSWVLVTTILMMSAATFLVGVLPTYEMVGIWSPIALLVLRLIQGFSTGGEYGSAATYIAESAADDRRGFMGSWLEVGTMAGYTLAAVLAVLLTGFLSEEALQSWGWRIPFLVGLPLGAVGLWLRTNLEDSPAFNAVKSEGKAEKAPLLWTIRHAWRSMLLCIGMVIMLNVAYYTVLKYMPTYFKDELGMSKFNSDLVSMGITVGILVLVPLLGPISDRIGRKPVWLTASGGFILLSTPAFYLMSLGSFWWTFLGLGILGFFTAVVASVVASTLPAIFRTQVRSTGFSISYNFSTAAFGGTAPLFITWLISRFDSHYIPAFYLMIAAAIAIIPTLKIQETAGAPLLGSRPMSGRRSRPRRRRVVQPRDLG